MFRSKTIRGRDESSRVSRLFVQTCHVSTAFNMYAFRLFKKVLVASSRSFRFRNSLTFMQPCISSNFKAIVLQFHGRIYIPSLLEAAFATQTMFHCVGVRRTLLRARIP